MKHILMFLAVSLCIYGINATKNKKKCDESNDGTQNTENKGTIIVGKAEDTGTQNEELPVDVTTGSTEGSEGIDIEELQRILEECGPDSVLGTCQCGDIMLYINKCVYKKLGPIQDGPVCGSCLTLTGLDKQVKRKIAADKRREKIEAEKREKAKRDKKKRKCDA